MNEFDKEEHTEDIWYSQIWNTFIPSVSGKSYTKINNV